MTTRVRNRRLLVALSAILCLAIAATGFASVTIYDNDFKSRHEFKSVKKAAGGKACDRSWHKRKALRIAVKRGKIDCAFEPPVFSDGSGGDVTVKAAFKIFSEGTTKKTRRGAFGFLALRASDAARYQVVVFPKSKRWELRRGPSSAEFPVKGKLKQIAPLDKRNTIQARVVNDRIDVWIQGKRVVRGKVDSDAAKISGKSIRLGLGQAKKTKKDTAGLYNRVRVDLPSA